jgi:hypothetical protein
VTALVCPSCGAGHADPAERFCTVCGVPLVFTDADADAEAPRVTAARERARKVLPQYAEGELTRVASARNQAEGELLQGMLLEEGVPSLMRRAGGFDVPDFLAAGPRDILVPASGAETARELLRWTPPPGRVPMTRPPWVRALAVALAVLIMACIAAAVLTAVFG